MYILRNLYFASFYCLMLEIKKHCTFVCVGYVYGLFGNVWNWLNEKTCSASNAVIVYFILYITSWIRLLVLYVSLFLFIDFIFYFFPSLNTFEGFLSHFFCIMYISIMNILHNNDFLLLKVNIKLKNCWCILV